MLCLFIFHRNLSISLTCVMCLDLALSLSHYSMKQQEHVDERSSQQQRMQKQQKDSSDQQYARRPKNTTCERNRSDRTMRVAATKSLRYQQTNTDIWHARTWYFSDIFLNSDQNKIVPYMVVHSLFQRQPKHNQTDYETLSFSLLSKLIKIFTN